MLLLDNVAKELTIARSIPAICYTILNFTLADTSPEYVQPKFSIENFIATVYTNLSFLSSSF